MSNRIVRRSAVIGVAAVLWACAPRPAPYQGSPSRGQMITHFDLAVDARGYAIMGDLDAFRDAADDLAELQPADDLPAELWLQFGPLRYEARSGGQARTLGEAAMASARIAESCGACHEANGVGLGDRFTIGGPPPPGTTGRHMAGLAWASRLLWDGLIGPSDRTWSAGAEGLGELGVLPEGLPVDLPAGDVRVAGVRLQQLAERALLSFEPEERISVLGEIWATCAGCHTGGVR